MAANQKKIRRPFQSSRVCFSVILLSRTATDLKREHICWIRATLLIQHNCGDHTAFWITCRSREAILRLRTSSEGRLAFGGEGKAFSGPSTAAALHRALVTRPLTWIGSALSVVAFLGAAFGFAGRPTACLPLPLPVPIWVKASSGASVAASLQKAGHMFLQLDLCWNEL